MPKRRPTSIDPFLTLLAAALALLAAACGAAASAARDTGLSTNAVLDAQAGGRLELNGVRLDVPPNALSAAATITLTSARDATAAVNLIELRSDAELLAPATLSIPAPARDDLALYVRGPAGLWSWYAPASSVDGHAVVSLGEFRTFALAPAGSLAAWQARGFVGGAPQAGERNALLLHGWNSSPWDGCQLELAAALAAHYDNVVAYAYPSALPIEDNAIALRDDLRSYAPGARFDVIAFSEGGLVARAAIEPNGWNGGDVIASQTTRLITIATPHLGLIDGLPPSMLDDVASEQMRARSQFLRALNAGDKPDVPYHLIAGDGYDGAGDGIVSVRSALAEGAIATASTLTLPLVHARAIPGAGAMPCNDAVYDAIASIVGG